MSLPKLAFGIKGKMKMRPKNDGRGIMISAFTTEVELGFGLVLTEDKLKHVNKFRRLKYSGKKDDLKESPGFRTFEYGANFEGYWTTNEFVDQLQDVLDVFECLYPSYQVVLETDNSGPHTARAEDALSVKLMNKKFKHSNPNSVRVRDTIITEECLGEYGASTLDPKTEKQVDVKLKVGETQTSFFPASVEHFEPRDYFYVNTEKNVKAEDLVDKPKGILQLLFERGCLESPTAKLSKPEAVELLGNMADYLAEENKFTRDVRCRGHRAIMSPIAHPELAGNGIEFAWGFSKLHYRRTNQKKGFTKGMEAFVKRFALCCGITNRTADGYDCFNGLEQTYKFARRARDYARIYRGGYSVASVIDIERIRKKKKSHRGALDQSTSFVSQEVEETAGQFDEAEKAVEHSLEVQKHTDTTTTT